MSKLPQVSGTRLVRALGRAGFREVHRRGSHVILVHRNDATRIAVVPMHALILTIDNQDSSAIVR